MVSDIEIMLGDSKSLFESIRSNLQLWREKINSKKQFKEEWQEFMIYTRKLIQKVAQTEENFLPKVGENFGNTVEIAESYQRRLDDFMPTIKVIGV